MDIADLHQYKKISDANNSAALAGHKAEKSAENVRALERKVERLIAINHALWELLKEAGQMSDEHLETRVAYLQAEHEKSKGAVSCVKCKRTSAAKFGKCMYCGEELPKQSLFLQLR